MARGDINEYYDPRHERQMAQMLKDSREMLKQGHLGGIASVMTRLGRRKKEALDEEKRKTAGRSLSKALMAKPWRDPNTEIEAGELDDFGVPQTAQIAAIAPGQLPQGSQRAFEALAMDAGQHPDNQYMARDLRNLLTQNIARKTAIGDRDEGREYKAGLLADKYNREDIVRADEQRHAINLESAKVKPPKTVNTATGVHILNNDGSLGTRLGGLPPGRGTQALTPKRMAQNMKLAKTRATFKMAAEIAAARELARLRPLPPSVIKKQDDLLEQYDIAENIDEDLGTVETQIRSGKLELGPLLNRAYEIKNWTGFSSEESSKYANMRTKLEKLRNDSLRLNKGIQTEGDAVRAWDEILANMNDPKIVADRLAEIRRLNRRAKEEIMFRVTTIRNEYGKEPVRRKHKGDIPDGWIEVK